MNSVFILKDIRNSISKKNQIVLQGLCNANLLEGKKLKVFWNSKDVKELSSKTFLRDIPDSEKNSDTSDVSKILDIVITLPKKIEDNSELYVTLLKEGKQDSWEQIFVCNGAQINACLKLLNYEVIDVSYEGKKTIVKGWVADRDKVSVAVFGDNDLSEKLDATIEWLDEYAEVVFSEDEKKKARIFELTFPSNEFACYIRFGAGERIGVSRVKPYRKAYKTKIGKKIGRYSHRFSLSLKHFGAKETAKKVIKRLGGSNSKKSISYDKWLDKREVSFIEAARMKKEQVQFDTKFSLFIKPVNKKYNHIFVESLVEQIYKNYELVDATTDFANYSFEEKKQYFVFGDATDSISEDMLYRCAECVEEYPDVLYCDEDTVDVDFYEHSKPILKPAYNVDMLRCYNYIRRIFAISKNMADKIIKSDMFWNIKRYNDLAKLEVSDYDLILRITELADGIKHVSKAIYSVGKSLVADFTDKGSLCVREKSDYAVTAVRMHLERQGINAIVGKSGIEGINDVTYLIDSTPLISIIIPNKDHWTDLKRCIDSINNRSIYRNYEFIIVENNSVEPETFEYYKAISARDNVKIVSWKGEFNYSALNNFGAKVAMGEYLLLLNNDTELMTEDAIYRLLGCCQRADVGVAGAKLYYEDNTVQHAGIIVGMGGIAGNAFAGVDEASGVYDNRTFVDSDYNAVTGACLMIKRSCFDEVNGLDEDLAVAFNDVDLCLRVRQLGKLVVYNANAAFYHYESKSRGTEDTEDKLDRFYDEIELFREKWKDVLEAGDEYFNEGFNLYKTDFSLSNR